MTGELAAEIESSINQFKRKYNLTADIKGDILTMLREVNYLKNTKEDLETFTYKYQACYQKAFKHIYQDLMINNTKINFVVVDNKLVPQFKNDTKLFDTVTKCMEAFDELEPHTRLFIYE